MSIAIETQVIVTWCPPEKALPPDDRFVVVTCSGRASKHVTYDHTLALANWIQNEDSWYIEEVDDEYMDGMTIHAWCDLEPYGGRDA